MMNKHGEVCLRWRDWRIFQDGWILICSLLLCLSVIASRATEVDRVAFGSCNRHELPQPVWEGVVAFRPQLWIWLGDNIYGDTQDMEVLGGKWRAQKERSDYQKAMEGVAVTGVWDDHDYGVNDGGKDYAKKEESKELFLKFLDVPPGDLRWEREGIYGSEVFGVPGRDVRVILLDVRSHRDKPRSGGDILGEAQWAWLEKTLSESRCAVHIFASGSQILPSEHRFEKWADYPEARERFLKLLAKYDVANPILLSGDRHHAEISVLKRDDGAQDLYEVTASGMTHSLSKNLNEKNSLRVGEGFGGLNFGTIEIDWEALRAELAIRDQAGNVVRSVRMPLGLK
ncbi:MAG: hypothetical protein Fur0032_25000 [Terrimicrobiaceae bacterium]